MSYTIDGCGCCGVDSPCQTCPDLDPLAVAELDFTITGFTDHVCSDAFFPSIVTTYHLSRLNGDYKVFFNVNPTTINWSNPEAGVFPFWFTAALNGMVTRFNPPFQPNTFYNNLHLQLSLQCAPVDTVSGSQWGFRAAVGVGRSGASQLPWTGPEEGGLFNELFTLDFSEHEDLACAPLVINFGQAPRVFLGGVEQGGWRPCNGFNPTLSGIGGARVLVSQ